MEAEEYARRRDELQRHAIQLKLSGVRVSQTGGLLGLTKEQHRDLFKPRLLTRQEKKAIKDARKVHVPTPAKKAPIEHKERRPEDTLKRRVHAYQSRGRCPELFTAEDVRKKFGPAPTCYLTGARIDYNDGKTYELDHLVPWSKGGESSLENLRLCSPVANRMKHNHDFWAFVDLCRKVVAHVESKA